MREDRPTLRTGVSLALCLFLQAAQGRLTEHRLRLGFLPGPGKGAPGQRGPQCGPGTDEAERPGFPEVPTTTFLSM